MENVFREHAYLRERKTSKGTPQRVARKRETMEIRKQQRKEKEEKNVMSRTEAVVRDENVTNSP